MADGDSKGKTDANTLSVVQAALTASDPLIERAFRRSESFRDLCEDYRECAAALRRWEQGNGTGASSRTQEYADLLLELGREIQNWLEAFSHAEEEAL